MLIGFHVEFPLFLTNFNKTWILWQIFEKSFKVRFNKNPSNVNRFVSCKQTDWQIDRQTDKQIGQSKQSLFWISWKRLKTTIIIIGHLLIIWPIRHTHNLLSCHVTLQQQPSTLHDSKYSVRPGCTQFWYFEIPFFRSWPEGGFL